MAPVKRRRAADDDEEIIAVESASSSLRQDIQRKKSRISESSQSAPKNNRRAIRSLSPSDAEPRPAPKRNDHEPFPSTQYDIDRDAAFTHLENPDRDDELATQRIKARTLLLGDNHAAENGIIESVTMINFMCHNNLHVTLGPLINFIVGENGSGKSAILTAITLSLGGKASTTNRGASLKSFIKEGRDHCSLVIKLKNQGVDAYQSDLYGETIIVERHFSKHGTSGYKLKNAAGRILSTKKSDVDEVIEYFQMQVDNPMSILSQDASRQFLTSATAAQKYKAFVKGVQLEQLDNDYRLVAETADAMEAKLATTKQQVKQLERKAEAAKQKALVVEQYKGMRDAIRRFGRMSAWAQVEEEESRLEERERVVTEAQEAVDLAEQDIDSKDQLYQRTNERVERVQREVQELNDSSIPLQEEESEAKAAFDNATKEVKTLHHEQRKIREHLVAARKKVDGVKNDIDTEIKRIENANGGAHAQKLMELAAAEEKVVEAKARLQESNMELPRLKELHQGAIEDHEKLSAPVELKRNEVTSCRSRLQSLNRDAGQIMSCFDKKMPSLIANIRDDSGYREKPIGPLGLHIKLTKPIWADILDRSIGNNLNGFIVTNKPDQVRLSATMRRLGINDSPVIMTSSHPIDTRNNEPDEAFDTVLRVLEFDNDLVRNSLIISQGIEQTILIQKRNDAMRVMYEGPRPRNVKQCFCLHDSLRGAGLRLGYTGGGSGASSGPINPPLGKSRMNTDPGSQIAYQKETLQGLEKQLSALQAHQREMHQNVQKYAQAITQHQRSQKTIELQIQRLEETFEQLEDELAGDNVEDGRLDSYKVYLEECERDVTSHEGSYGEAGLAKEKQNIISSECKQVLDAVKARVAQHEVEVKKAEDKLKRYQQARQVALQDKNAVIERVEELKSLAATAEAKKDKQALQVATFTAQASQICARMPIVGETAASLDAKLSKLSEQVKAYSKRNGGSDDEILAACEAAERAYQTASGQLETLETLLRMLKQSYEMRLQKWRRFQQHISAQSRMNFTYLLSERGFRGRLKLDHQNKLLDIEVEPDETKKSGKGRATKTLSGGEKSFSSICLLMSLWEAMGAPLRCLDEFDVFMDNVNRDVSTNLIIGAARRSVGKQFILITPTAIGGNADRDADVKLIKLTDPRQRLLADL